MQQTANVNLLPAAVRRIVYGVFSAGSLALGGTEVGYSAADATKPVWLVVAMAVWGFIGLSTGLLALSNTADVPIAGAEAEVVESVEQKSSPTVSASGDPTEPTITEGGGY